MEEESGAEAPTTLLALPAAALHQIVMSLEAPAKQALWHACKDVRQFVLQATTHVSISPSSPRAASAAAKALSAATAGASHFDLQLVAEDAIFSSLISGHLSNAVKLLAIQVGRMHALPHMPLLSGPLPLEEPCRGVQKLTCCPAAHTD